MPDAPTSVVQALGDEFVVEAAPRSAGGWRSSLAGGLVRTARPRQWLKNVLVFAAPGAAGTLLEARTVVPVAAAVLAWCLVASGTYFLNDARDIDRDRVHPRKRLRPVAAGIVPLGWAYGAAVALYGTGLVIAAVGANGGTALVLAGYGAVSISYSLWLKDEPVVELVALSSGFVLRAVSGGVAAGVPISDWFFIVASFGSLFMVAGKRHAEHVGLAADRSAHRRSLDGYTVDFLRSIRWMAAAVAITAYCLWAFEKAEAADGVFFELSIAPFVVALLRYGLLVESGTGGGAPEEVVLTDRRLQVAGAVWAAVFALGVYTT